MDELTPGIDEFARECRLEGRPVLDVGFGTGRVLGALVERYGARPHGMDASERMLAVAAARLPGADLRLGRAEELPWPDETFEAALMTLVVHHLDRPRAFAEARRVLVQGGRLLIVTPDRAAFPRAWLAPLFPSYVAVEQRRLPGGNLLEHEL